MPIEPTRLLIRRDHVLEAMLTQLGAKVAYVTEAFKPEGGAYGTGRTMGHSHGPETATHAHAETFGWHDHGDGHMHFHPAKPK